MDNRVETKNYANNVAQFEHQNYLNLETYRKNGQSMPTPVWFVEDQGVIYVRTGAQSGKIKRIRNNPSVRVAPCDARGGLLGDWTPGRAELIGPDKANDVNRLLKRKYGLPKMLFDVLGWFQRFESATVAIYF